MTRTAIRSCHEWMRIGFAMAVVVALPISSSLADTFGDALKDSATPAPAADEAIETQKTTDTPSFWQRDSRGAFENEGRDYCSPVAVSNSLCYLARHGFPALLPDGDGVQPQIDLIRLLASSDYFGTDPTNGTSPGSILSGLQKYIEEKGYHCERLEYEGWRKVGRSEADAVKAAQPELAWMKEGIRDPHGSVWLNIGWYARVEGSDSEWKRIGGHWITLVGYGAAHPDDPPNSHLLLVHNPATRGSDDQPDDPAQDVIYLKKLSEGTLDTGKDSTEDAAGMYQISGPGLPISKSVDAFLDDAIVLVVGR